MTTPDVDAAAGFLAGNARVLDRRRFERLFSRGDARSVRGAVAAYRNADGGFGHALEPDGRTPASQPAAVAMAPGTLDEADAWDEELVAGACGWVAAMMMLPKRATTRFEPLVDELRQRDPQQQEEAVHQLTSISAILWGISAWPAYAPISAARTCWRPSLQHAGVL